MNLKRKIYELIVNELGIRSLSSARELQQRLSVTEVLSTLDEKKLDALELDAKKARRDDDKEAAAAKHKRLRALIDAATKKHFPAVDTMGTKFEMVCIGYLWSDSFEDKCCYVNENGYGCTDPAHTDLYSERFKILAVDGSTVYEHFVDSEIESINHEDGWVFIKADLQNNYSMRISQLNWKLVTKDFESFVGWLKEVHEIAYNMYASGASGDNKYPKEYAGQMIENRLADARYEFCRSDDESEENQ